MTKPDYEMSAKTIKYLEPDQIHRIIECIDNTTSKNPDRDKLIAEIMWRTGARVSEVIVLTANHISSSDFGNIIKLKNLKQVKKDKSGRIEVEIINRDGVITKRMVHDSEADKEIIVSKEFCIRLLKFCEDNHFKKDDYLFPNNNSKLGYVSRLYVWRVLNRASLSAGIEIFGKKNPRSKGGVKGAYPHMFRHSNAMHLLDKTKNIKLVQQELGHASVNTTQVYTFVKTKEVEKQIENIEW
jgi:integrase/recombinase XerD